MYYLNINNILLLFFLYDLQDDIFKQAVRFSNPDIIITLINAAAKMTVSFVITFLSHIHYITNHQYIWFPIVRSGNIWIFMAHVCASILVCGEG